MENDIEGAAVKLFLDSLTEDAIKKLAYALILNPDSRDELVDIMVGWDNFLFREL